MILPRTHCNPEKQGSTAVLVAQLDDDPHTVDPIFDFDSNRILVVFERRSLPGDSTTKAEGGRSTVPGDEGPASLVTTASGQKGTSKIVSKMTVTFDVAFGEAKSSTMTTSPMRWVRWDANWRSRCAHRRCVRDRDRGKEKRRTGSWFLFVFLEW